MSGFSNRRYVGELSRLDTSTPTLTIRTTNPNGRYASHRQVAAFIYELAVELERMCAEAGTAIAVCPEPMDGRIVVETFRNGDEVLAQQLLRRLMAEHELVPQTTRS